MVTPVRSRSRWRRGRDSVHADEAAAETGDPARSPTFAEAPEGATPRLRASTGPSGNRIFPKIIPNPYICIKSLL